MKLHSFIAAALVVASAAYAQEIKHERRVEIVTAGGGPGDIMQHVSGPGNVIGLAGPVVKGAPYSAEAVTETTRTLTNGSRINQRNSSETYRDSEGRTRRETTVGAAKKKVVFIHDPVANASYTLDESARTARKLPGRAFFLMSDEGSPGGPQRHTNIVIQRAEAGTAAPMILRRTGGREAKVETLGKQTVEGVVCEGTRTVAEIPAGEVGNDQPLQITTERWYSPELKTVVMSKHSDPLAGETTYRLLNIRRAEPARTLFEVPSDYTVTTEMPKGFRIEKKD